MVFGNKKNIENTGGRPSPKSAPADQQRRKVADPVRTAKNWYSDRYQSMVIQRNLLGLVLMVSLVAIALGAFAIQIITKNKTIEPFVIEVSEKTGIATVVDQLSVQQFVANDIVSRYFIVQYIQAREGYDFNTYSYNYTQVVRLFSGQDVYAAFRNYVNQSNPESPPTKLGSSAKRVVKISSINFLQNQNVQVRFTLTDIGRGGAIRETKHKVAVLRYNFVQLQLDIEQRYINPLGFVITSYTVDDEAL
ncbi:MAG: virB8 [Rickettsiales bacterium]|jgi:type IV secretion system protein VirB8|nr:virB8 [Rickettsiales bacterium]